MLVCVLIADLFEDVEFWYPYYRLLETRHEVAVVGCHAGEEYAGKRGTAATSTTAASSVDLERVAGVIVPGGYSPDHMRRCPALVDLVRSAGEDGRLVAAICHGPWMLASAGLLEGRRVTSFSSISDDLVNAGATWVDEETVRDGNLITARSPDDLPSFMREVVAFLGPGGG